VGVKREVRAGEVLLLSSHRKIAEACLARLTTQITPNWDIETTVKEQTAGTCDNQASVNKWNSFPSRVYLRVQDAHSRPAEGDSRTARSLYTSLSRREDH
jgi:hypothetical protein